MRSPLIQMHLQQQQEQSAVIPKQSFWPFMKINPLIWKTALCLTVGGTALGGSMLVAWAVFQQDKPQDLTLTLKRPQVTQRDPNWLTDLNYCAPETGRTIMDCYAQMKLWLEYVLKTVQGDEALRYRSKASEFMTNPKVLECYGRPQQVCLRGFARLLSKDMEKSFTLPENQRNAALAGAMIQYLALSEARIGSPESSVAPIDALIKRIPEKFESDLALYYTSEGINEKALKSLGDRYEYRVEVEEKPHDAKTRNP
ncbi:hypothetical protein [Oscillatoria sp. FACHB-1406]|uniref:hypothetical protein n=1 Tax=Oscillatoria sp. FACHB-1406 TaxID=2692846 RepID=UPI001686852E|nr:hypothetical protein [Oscillatoria sp. FACHB-1406]MBD2580304.1 hypothetical protein [Oscillatoria sp. FACHB-1406]